MKKYAHLSISEELFSREINAFINSGKSLLEIAPKTEEEFKALKAEVRKWKDEICAYLDRAFVDGYKDMYERFCQNSFSQQSSSISTTFGIPLQSLISNIYTEVQSRCAFLEYNLRIVLACDAIARPQIDISERARLTENNKMDFLLRKLSEFTDDSCYSIKILLIGNGIKIRPQSPEEYAKMLEIMGFVDFPIGGIDSDDVYVRINTYGIIHIEQEELPVLEDYSAIPDDREVLSELIEYIIAELTKHKLLNKIITDDLYETKLLFGSLNKRSWGQLLKGKLIDLKVSGQITDEIMIWMFKELTNNESLLH